MGGLVRSACLNNYAQIARSFGLDPLQELRKVGLEPKCLHEPDLKIPIVAVARLLENAAHTLGVMDFGLRMAQSRKLSNLGPLALLCRDASTIRAALMAIRNFMYLHNQGLVMNIEESGGIAVLRIEQISLGNHPIRQAMELSVAMTQRVLKTLLGHHWHPLVICFRHSAPPDDSPHRRAFGTSVQFDSPMDGIVCRSNELDKALPNSDPEMARYVQQYLETIREDVKITLLAQVRQIIWTLVTTGHCTADQVAACLKCDRRTLHRQLVREGETFSTLLDQTRAELALRHLESSTIPLGEIAARLGFSELSAFSRWFNRHFHYSPSAWRARHADGCMKNGDPTRRLRPIVGTPSV